MTAPVLPYRPQPPRRIAFPRAGTVVPSFPELPTQTASDVDGVAALVQPAGGPPAQAPIALLPAAAPPPPPVVPVSSPEPAAPKQTAASRPHSSPAKASGGGDQRGPHGPYGPPGRSSFGTTGSAPAGSTAAGLWCAILLGLAAYGVRELRRHRLQFVALEQGGFVSPQQRPG
jgi:hypothetical protein